MSEEGPPPPCWRHSSFLPRWSGWRRTPPGRAAGRGCGPGRRRPIPMPCAARSPRWPSSPRCSSRTTPSGRSRSPISAPPSSCSPCRVACSRAPRSPSSRSPSSPRASSRAIWAGSPGTPPVPRRCASSRRPRRSRRGYGSRSIPRGTSWTARHATWRGRARPCARLASAHRETIARAWEMCIAFGGLCARASSAIEVSGLARAIGGGPLVARTGRRPLLASPPGPLPGMSSPPDPLSAMSSPPDPLSAMRRGGTPRKVVPPLHTVERGSGGEDVSAERGPGGEDGNVERVTDVVPFDLALAPDEFTVLVSGPNTGGKTVLINALPLLCLMAQSGIIPPIGPHSTLPAFTTWFADIGDRQSIAQSLSTFSAHLAVLRDILARAGAGSLVLLDEIGSGTDPAEGAALASAVLRTLTRRRSVTLATSHLGALKKLATETVGVVNASLQFDAVSLTPTYRLLKGVPGRSYGLAIAQRLGVPADVLAEAERALPDTERALDALLPAAGQPRRDLETRALSLAAAEQRLAEGAGALEARERDVADRERDVAARARAPEREARDHAHAHLLHV